MKRICTLLILLPTLIVHSYGQSLEETENEIKRIRSELLRIQKEREQVHSQTTEDEAQFAEYRKRALEQIRGIQNQTDSLSQQLSILQQDSDSLQALIDGQQRRRSQFELQQKQFSRFLLQAATALQTVAAQLPPGPKEKHASSLSLIATDLQSEKVQNVEALNRIFTVAQSMQEATEQIQLGQGPSPVADMRGTTYSIRIGTFYLAVVNMQGTKAALWQGYDENGAPQWQSIDDPLIATNILRAVQIREGKKLPDLVELPLYDTPVVEAGAGK